MKRFFIIHLFFLFSCLGTFSEIPSRFVPDEIFTKSPVVLFYGSSSCGHCQFFSKNMQAEKIPFIFYDVKKDSEKKREMWLQVKTIQEGVRSVTFPVLDIGGKVLVSPSYTEFKKLLKQD